MLNKGKEQSLPTQEVNPIEVKKVIESGGKEIEPHKEVSKSVANAVKDVTDNLHTDLKPMEANMLFNKLKGKDLAKYDYENGTDVISVGEEGLQKKQFEKLEEKGYVYDFSHGSGDYGITEKGKQFIDRVNARLETRKNVKSGIDLFPEDANIPEFVAIKKELKTLTDDSTINNFGQRTADEVKLAEPIVKSIESKAKSDNEAELNEAIQEADKFIEQGTTVSTESIGQKPTEPRPGEPSGTSNAPKGNVEAKSETISKFDQAKEMLDKIEETDGASKKRALAEERRKFMEDNPSMKRIDDNMAEINKQLEEKGLIKKMGNCP